MSLPVVPAGQNPFVVYRAAIEASARSTPTDGFAARLVVLLAVLSIIYWLLLYRDWKRTGRGNPTWLFRIVERPSGRYIVTNLKLALTFFTVVASALLLAFIAETYQFYVLDASRSRVITFKTWSGMPLFVQVYTNVVDAALWKQIVKVTTALGRLERSWTPSSDNIGPLLELGPEFRKLAANRTTSGGAVQLAILCVLLITHLKFNIEHLKRRAGSGVCSDATSTFDSTQASGCASFLVPRHLSRRQLVELAHSTHNSADEQRVQHIQRLQKVQKELLITSCLTLVMILSGIAFCIYSLHALATGHAQKLQWATNEAELLLLPWIYSVSGNAVLISLLYIRWDGLSLQVEQRDASWLGRSPVDRRSRSGGLVLSGAGMSVAGRHLTTVIDLNGGEPDERAMVVDKETDGVMDEEKEVESSHLRLASSSTSSVRT
ncbi:hypothetical protein JCM10296v2_007571 [Rhodotorula toruloides]